MTPTVSDASPAESAELLEIAIAAAGADGVRPVSEDTELRVKSGSGSQLLAVHGDDGIAGWASLAADGVAELVVHPQARRRGFGGALLAGLRERAPHSLRVWAHGDLPGARALAERNGATATRLLHQMRRPLDAAIPDPQFPEGITLRAFQPGADESAWLRVNARAFADHPEQGGWTLEDVLAREAEPWFDPAGLLLAERDGSLVGSHWTKTHDDPPRGEVYVVAVDPDAQGLGLGKALVLAGLASLRDRGLPEAMLYVDDDNAAAVGLYRRLGFEVAVTDVLWGIVRPTGG